MVLQLESAGWPGGSTALYSDRALGAWDDVLCGDIIYEALDSGELCTTLGVEVRLRYVLRGFSCANELRKRIDLYTKHFNDPLPFDEEELRPLVERFLDQIRRLAVGCDDELLEMLDNPIMFDSNVFDPHAVVDAHGDGLWGDLIASYFRGIAPEDLIEQESEREAISGLIKGWVFEPEIKRSVCGPLRPVEGYDPDIYLQCWIRNAHIVIDSDAVRVSKRIEQ